MTYLAVQKWQYCGKANNYLNILQHTALLQIEQQNVATYNINMIVCGTLKSVRSKLLINGLHLSNSAYYGD